MLVQTSMAVAFSNMDVNVKVLRKATEDQVKNMFTISERVAGSLRAKVGTIKVNDQINISQRTYKALKADNRLPVWMQ